VVAPTQGSSGESLQETSPLRTASPAAALPQTGFTQARGGLSRHSSPADGFHPDKGLGRQTKTALRTWKVIHQSNPDTNDTGCSLTPSN